MKKAMTVMAVLLVVTMIASVGYAWEKGAWRHHKRQAIKDELNLTDEQQAQMIKIKADFIKETADIKADLMVKRNELFKMLRDPNASEKDLLAKHSELNQLQSKMMDTRFKKKLAMRKVLTPEQLEKFFDMLPGMGKGMMGHCRGMGPDRGMAPGMGMGPGMGFGAFWEQDFDDSDDE